uniref:A kinase (PRKA) anchor protein 9 n=1 Tax=Sphaeramia orbicularis TaxID=375764 RepID=A0A672Z8R3_9TELE
MEAKDREIAVLNEQITKLQHMETASDNKVTLYEMGDRDEVIKDLECQVECLRSEQDRLKRNNEEELDQLNAVIEKLQQELANIEQKQPEEDYEDDKGEFESPSKEEYDEMKQKMDLATKELDTLKAEHSKLLETYLRLKENAEALAETEKLENSEGEVEDTLREKTAALVVMQAQVQALEQSATSRVEELDLRIQELEDLVNEKDSELNHCRLLAEQTQRYADDLQQRVCNLEENLREKVAAAIVSQATLEAFQQQQQQQTQQPKHEGSAYNFGDFGIPQLDLSGLGQVRPGPTGKVVHLTQKLRELEVGLSGMQKDQELQKQLLSSSEEEVLEYEKRLAVLMDLLNQMKTRTHQRTTNVVVRFFPGKNSSPEEDRDSITEILQELQEVKNDATITKEELDSYRQRNEKLEEDLHLREVSISKLKEELQEVRKNVETTKEEVSNYRKNSSSSHSSNKSHSPRTNGSAENQHAPVTDSFTQTEALQMSELGLVSKSTTKEEVEEVIGEFQDKIVQMQELHAAEILDMEARHISESENLRRDTQALEEECKALKTIIDKLRSNEVRPQKNTVGYRCVCSSGKQFSDSLKQEFRTTPEGARRETDDPLPDRIKVQHELLYYTRCKRNRFVHQEGMQVLSLSELPLSEGEPGGQFNIQGWMKERDALVHVTSGSVDWRGELLDAVQRVFLSERSVLKNTLYSQLDLLDTSDAIIHLNQLERRLALGVLHTADRSSLISEIHQLRGQIEKLHQGEADRKCVGGDPGVSLGGERGVRELREGGGADGGVEANRLLVEELKGELSQTKLELETTLKAQHKHLKELDALRAEVSQKAAEVDALNDHLTEERKKSRDLQWAVEKERCRTGRNEESKREELEVRSSLCYQEPVLRSPTQLTIINPLMGLGLRNPNSNPNHDGPCPVDLSLEEQKNRVSQLTSTLEQERQASSQVSQQAEQERLSLHRRLQELQVQLETERAKAQEMSTALGRERTLRRGTSSDSGPSNEERLLSQVEAQRLEAVRKEEELTLVSQRSRRDQEALLEARAQLESLEARTSEVQEQLEREVERNKHLEEEKDRLEERLGQHGEQRGEREGSGGLQADAHSLCFLHLYPQSPSLLAGGSSSSSNSLTERLLRQNAELTGFVSRLTEEKNDLRNHTLRLEDELRRYRQSTSRRGTGKVDNASLLLSQEREAWTRERMRLEKALNLAQTQVAQLRAEVRTETLREISGPEADNRMYGKYLRSESFRKALIYQKKYLLLLLGGFQECEEATLTLLSRMGSRPSLSSLESLSQRRRGLMRFRSAVRVSIALSRMRFLVKRWHKATGMSSTTTVTKNGGGQTIGTQTSAVMTSGCQRMFHVSGDHGALTCSHLQSYDPDRALTDYISRLEALQRRLGSVTSGNKYYPIHY